MDVNTKQIIPEIGDSKRKVFMLNHLCYARLPCQYEFIRYLLDAELIRILLNLH